MIPVIKYFNGEKAESYLFILMGVISLLMAAWFFFFLKSSFWKAVAIPFFIVAMLELVVGYTIVTRSPKDIARVEGFYNTDPSKIKTEEIPRMEKVMSNFVVFRYVEILLILAGVVLMYGWKHDHYWKGLGLGLFIQASIVLTLDFFAERRGQVYLDYLKELSDKL